MNAIYKAFKGQTIKGITLPAITYPECEGCPCKPEDIGSKQTSSQYTLLTRYSEPSNYTQLISTNTVAAGYSQDDKDTVSLAFSQAVAEIGRAHV